MIRAKQGGRLFDDFKDRSAVAIGWADVGSLEDLHDRETISARVAACWPDWHPQKISMSVGQLYRFREELAIGDRVVTYDRARRVYLVGTIKGQYRYDPEWAEDASNVRDVSWDGEISRDVLSISTKNSLGAISTLFLLPPKAASEIEVALSGLSSHTSAIPTGDVDEADESDLLKDVQERAAEFIKDHLSGLDWDQMQELVAGLLRAMGYKTRVSPSGPDRGKDIVASPDGFGFEAPRIVVEVKHRRQTMGSQEVRSFLGGRHRDDKGLYVSTGGFTREAYYEAERANIPVTLMNLDDLVEAITEHYEALDIETKQLIPLKRIYWPT